MSSFKKPADAKKDDGKAPCNPTSPDGDVATGPAWSRGQLLDEEAVLSDVFALRAARIPDDVYAFAVALNPDGSERRGDHDDKQDGEQGVSEVPEAESQRDPSETDVDDIVPAFEQEASAQIAKAVADLSRLRDDLLRDAEFQLVELAGVIARRVVARELRTDSGFLRSLVKEGIAALAEGDRVVVRLGSAFVPERDSLLEQLATNSMKAEVLVDEDLSPSGCVIETTFGRVDESLDARFDALMGSLRPESDCD